MHLLEKKKKVKFPPASPSVPTQGRFGGMTVP